MNNSITISNIDLARTVNKLSFAESVIAWKHEQLMDLLDLDEESENYFKEKINEAVECIKDVNNLLDGILHSGLGLNYVDNKKDAIKPRLPDTVKWIFDQPKEGWADKRELDKLVNRGCLLVFWTSGVVGSDAEYSVLLFPKNTNPVLLETWWGIAKLYVAPSYLKRYRENAYEMRSVEE